MFKKHSFIFLILLIISTACTSTNISSKVADPNYDKKIEGIFYALYFTEDIDKALPAFSEETAKHLELNSIEYEIKKFGFFDNPDEFVLDSLYQDSKEQGLSHLLVVSEESMEVNKSSNPGYFSGGMYVGGGSTKTIIHGLNGFLYDVETQKELWRSKIEVKSGSFGNSKQTGRSLARELLEQLSEDDLLESFFMSVQ